MEQRLQPGPVGTSDRVTTDPAAVVGTLLRLSIDGFSPADLLMRSLDLLLTLDWLGGARGCVFLVEPHAPETLVMVGSRGLSEEVLACCAEVPFGTCLCGMAAQTGEILYCDGVGAPHQARGDLSEHGHYVVPIAAHGDCLGVINLYLASGHEPSPQEQQLLQAVAHTAAGLIQRDRADRLLHESECQLTAIVEAFDGLLYVCSADYVIEYMNERFKALCDSDPDSAIANPVGEICYEVIHGRETPCPWCANERVLAGETVRWEVQLRQDGRYYMVVNRPIVHEDGRLSKISMSTDITERHLAEEKLEHLVEHLESVLQGVVLALSSTTSQRDPYTAIHQQRVTRLCVAIAEEMGEDQEFIKGLRTAALLHDIGKIAVPSEILSKPGRLSEMEMGIVKTHASVGHKLLEPVPFEHPVARSVLEHHERVDGSGYPDGLHGDELLLESKIIAVADVVEAMASHRPYRPALGLDAAIDEIEKNAGTKYDEDVARACVSVLRSAAGESIL